MNKILSAGLLAAALTSCAPAEPPLTLSEGKITDAFHQEQTGKMYFMADWLAYDTLKQENYLTSVDLVTNPELNARMFLDKTLTAHLADLAPGLSVRDLCDAGSFQFNFLVDGKSVHRYNLQTGAGSCDYKNEATVYGIPLWGEEEVDHWGRFLWMKFMKRDGGEAALARGRHKLTIEVRPYVKLDTVSTGPIIAVGQLQISNEQRKVAASEIIVQPIAPTERFLIAQTPLDTELIEAMNRRIIQGRYEDVTSIIVLQAGELLLEEYFNGADRATLHDTRSVGKSFAGTLAGIALKEGHLESVDQPLTEFYTLSDFANPSPAKANTTLLQLLTMTAGFAGNDADPTSPGQEEKMYPTADWVRFTLDLPGRADTDWSYSSASAVLLGDILHKTVPGGLEAYAAEKLFSPLGITDQRWAQTPTGVGNTAGSLAMSSLSLATYAQLYLNDKQDILPASWISTSLSPLIERNDKEAGHYSYLLWHNEVEVAGKTYATTFASGNGGNKVIMIPELEVVIVITATAYGKPYAHQQADEILTKYLLPAVLQPAD